MQAAVLHSWPRFLAPFELHVPSPSRPGSTPRPYRRRSGPQVLTRRRHSACRFRAWRQLGALKKPEAGLDFASTLVPASVPAQHRRGTLLVLAVQPGRPGEPAPLHASPDTRGHLAWFSSARSHHGRCAAGSKGCAPAPGVVLGRHSSVHSRLRSNRSTSLFLFFLFSSHGRNNGLSLQVFLATR